MNVPSDYLPGYEKARAVDPDVASCYIEHTTIGDPEADELTEALADLEPQESRRILQLAMDAQSPADLRELPPAVRDFYDAIAVPPDWVDEAAYIPGVRMFHRNSRLVLGAMVGGTLVEGFSTNISKSFFITGRVRDQGVRRLKCPIPDAGTRPDVDHFPGAVWSMVSDSVRG